MIFVRRRLRSFGRRAMEYPSGDQNGAKVVDVRQRWSGLYRIADGIKKSMTVVGREHGARVQPFRLDSSKSIRRQYRTGDFIHAVDPIRISRESPNSVRTV